MAQNYELIIEAAGGLLVNSQGQLLCIYRNNFWDLPKGKIEAGESIEAAAVREVVEECGVPEPLITCALETTLHTYPHPKTGQIVLKRTYWFAMKCTDEEGNCGGVLTPQREEGITEAVWADCTEVRQKIPLAYENIARLMTTWVASACPDSAT